MINNALTNRSDQQTTSSWSIMSLPIMQRQNYLILHTPAWLHWIVRTLIAPVKSGDVGPPRQVDELTNAKWPGSWPVPSIRGAKSEDADETESRGEELGAGVWVALYIFSTPTIRSHARRDLIRQYSPLDSLPLHLRHFVSVKFVIGYAGESQSAQPNRITEEDDEDEDEESRIRAESEKYQDIVRLPDLVNGENMNDGKTWEWIKYAGVDGKGREAQWILYVLVNPRG